MADHATPNLPSRDFEITSRFFTPLGFEQAWRDEGWMILKRGDLTLEFFPHPDVDPWTSSFSCCLRLDDLDAFYADCKGGGPAGNLQRPSPTAPSQAGEFRPAHGRADRPRRHPGPSDPEPGLADPVATFS